MPNVQEGEIVFGLGYVVGTGGTEGSDFTGALDKFSLLTIFCSNISIPPMIPLIIYLSLLTGGFILQDHFHLDFSLVSFEIIKKNLLRYIIGSLVLATFCSIVSGVLSYFLLTYFSQKKVKNA